MRAALFAVLLVVLTACAPTYVRPPGEPLPSAGLPSVGVPYRMTLLGPDCTVPFEIGASVWRFLPGQGLPPSESKGWWEDNFGSVDSSYPIPGILTLESPNTATFRADVDGSEIRFVAGHPEDVSAACL